MPARQTETGEELQTHRGRIQQTAGFSYPAKGRQTDNSRQSSFPAYDGRRDRCVVRPALHPPAPSQIQRKDDTGFRDDQVLGKYPPGMFRRLCFLHHLGTSGEVHRFAKQRVDTERSEEDYADAGLQRISERSRRSFGQYVPDERKESGYLRPVQEAVMHLSCRLQEPECRSYAAVRDIQRSG